MWCADVAAARHRCGTTGFTGACDAAGVTRAQNVPRLGYAEELMPIRKQDRSRYPKNWPSISGRIRRERAQGRCECTGQCGVDHGGRCRSINGERTASGSCIVLTVHHLNHEPEDCSDENLIACCQGCHLRMDADIHKRHGHDTRRAKKRDLGQMELAPWWNPDDSGGARD